MAAQKDYYQTLGVKRDADAEAIRKAYRRLARKYHPDLNPGDKSSEDRFKAVQEAYDVLSEPKKKQMYDQFGSYSDSGFPGAGAGPQPGGPGMGFGGFDFSDFVSQAGAGRADAEEGFSFGGGAFRDLFGQFFGRRGEQRGQAAPERGSDLEYALDIDFWQAIRGTQIRLTVQRQEACSTCGGAGTSGSSSATCPQCGGSGKVEQMAGAMRFSLSCPRCGGTGKLRNVCPDCHGDGRLSRDEAVEVRIPPGVQSGSRLRVAGKGNAGTQGALPGDLYITVRVQPHEFFQRDGSNIEIEVPISVPEAALGAKIEVPTIDGRALLKIPQGTQNGQKFRLREKGVVNSRNSGRGDQIVRVVVQAPKAQDERTREILRELAKLHPEDPREGIWAKV